MKKNLIILAFVAAFAFGGFFGYVLATLPIARIIFATFCIIGIGFTFFLLLYLIYKKDPDKPTYPKPETWTKDRD